MKKNLGHLRIGKRLARNWWTLALRGILAIIFGSAALFWPEFTLPILVFLFAAFALGGGILLAIAALKHLNNIHGWFLLIEGAIGIAAGVLPFIWPDITALVLLYLTAAWAIITGIFEIIAANYVRREVENEWLLVGAGIASIVFGILLVIWPLAETMNIVWIIAAYAIFFGVVMLVFALRLKKWGEQLKLL
ncbi:HdeD family acid-resistance protein [Nostoc sp. FACHB-152]|uniref:HdeD family acid-resistance protein n=1 Tax=unclassified Nostoc TaxID=2593658 RepID=UPI001687B8EE|nr:MULTISPECIES: HdeD family acid-resistance protein [unclassified Nostoc]MBD2446223.1 HdeD family acid-resistance protein [Nostoc sp. FACHB-152]MBD2469493.1 HdeD family acid-resistance protein [Nostoc sp. FACHB-145]